MKDSKVRAGEINGFLDRTTSLVGELRFSDTMRIDGRVKGRILSDNVLVVGETAEIEGEIEVASISIMGKVRGTLRATVRVEVHPRAVLLADVTTPVLRIDEGAVFQGRCDMQVEHGVAEQPVRLSLVEPAIKVRPT